MSTFRIHVYSSWGIWGTPIGPTIICQKGFYVANFLGVDIWSFFFKKSSSLSTFEHIYPSGSMYIQCIGPCNIMIAGGTTNFKTNRATRYRIFWSACGFEMLLICIPSSRRTFFKNVMVSQSRYIKSKALGRIVCKIIIARTT